MHSSQKRSDDITKVVINKYNLDGKSYSQYLKEDKEIDIILNTQILYSLCLDKKIKRIKSGNLASVSEKILKKSFSNDFKELDYLNFLLNKKYLRRDKEITPTLKFTNLMQKSNGEIIKKLYDDAIKSEKIDELADAPFASCCRGKYVKFLRDMILKIIKKQDTSLWINIDTIVDAVKLDKTTLRNVTNGYRYGYIFVRNNFKRGYNDIEDLKVVIRYFTKSFIGIMHQFGLCKVAHTRFQAYNKEDVAIIKNNQVGRYANLEYFQLNELGLFVLGLKKEFKDNNDYKLLLNEYALEFVIENRNTLSDLLLENIAIEISKDKYKTDVKTFMKKISKTAEYKNIESSFLNKVEGDVPKNWKDFFSLLNKRQKSASVVSSSVVLVKLENNREFLKLLSADVKLQEKILKADKMHIVVLRENLDAVKKILKGYGILI